MIRLIEPEELSTKWSLIKPKVDAALAHGIGETTSHELFVDCMNMGAQCWLIEDGENWIKGVGITRFIGSPNHKQLQVLTLTGKGMLEEIEKCCSMMDEFAKGTGCKSISVYGRKGWGKVLPKEYKLAYNVYIKEL